MKPLIAIIIVVVIGVIFYLVRNRPIPDPIKKEPDALNPYSDLRKQVFSTTRVIAGIPEDKNNSVWGVVVEFVLSNETVTIVSLADGNASIYLSTGGGFIGGLGHEQVMKAAINTVNISQQFKVKMKKVDLFPLPSNGTVTFYLLADDGIYSITDSEEKVTEQKSELSPLFFAAQEVVTQYRIIQP